MYYTLTTLSHNLLKLPSVCPPTMAVIILTEFNACFASRRSKFTKIIFREWIKCMSTVLSFVMCFLHINWTPVYVTPNILIWWCRTDTERREWEREERKCGSENKEKVKVMKKSLWMHLHLKYILENKFCLFYDYWCWAHLYKKKINR